MPIERGNQLFGLCLKAEMLYVALCPFCGLVDRRLCLPFPDSGQQGDWGVVIVMPQLLSGSSQPRIITLWPIVLLAYNWQTCVVIADMNHSWVVFSSSLTWLFVSILGWQRMSQRRSGTVIQLMLFSLKISKHSVFFRLRFSFLVNMHLYLPHSGPSRWQRREGNKWIPTFKDRISLSSFFLFLLDKVRITCSQAIKHQIIEAP